MSTDLIKTIVSVLTEETLDEAKASSGKMKDFIDAQTVGKPLANEDGSAVKDTVYLGDDAYLRKSGSDLFIAVLNPRIRSGADGSMSWEKYMSYDDKIQVTPAILKAAASYASKV